MTREISGFVLCCLGVLEKVLDVWVEGFFVDQGYQVSLLLFSGFLERLG